MDYPEYKALTQCYPRLSNCVQQSPNDVVAQLRPSGILAPGDLSFLDNPQNSNDQKARRVIDAVLNQVKIKPRVFHTFVSALEAAGPWTNTIVSELNDLCASSSATSSIAPHTDSIIQAQTSQIPTDTDKESSTQVAKDLYKEGSAQAAVGDAPVEKFEKQGICVCDKSLLQFGEFCHLMYKYGNKVI